MLSLRNSLMGFAFMFALTLFAAVPQAFAIATLEVTVTDGKNALPGETISLFSETGTEVKKEKSKDGVTYFNELEPGTYTVKSGDKTLRTVTITPEDTVKRIAVVAPAFIRVPNWPNWSASDLNVDLGLRGIAKYGGFDAMLLSPGFGNPSGEFGLDGFGAGIDLMVRPPNLADIFFLASFGWLGDLDDSAAEGDLHAGTPGFDSYLSLEEDAYLRFMLGWTFMRSQQFELDAIGGIQGTDREITLHTDESGGGGRMEHFSNDEWSWDPVFGIQVRHQTNLKMFNSGRGKGAQLYGNITGTHMGSVATGGTSSLGFTYAGEADSGWQTEASFGILFPF
ncbi:MAG: hypothetical protein H6867_11515 [Rhodospirillales bacterium]|nr:hypothetical protein [Rhodospirillales bacterium]MCB9996758.1 hypothetical protein [Rhodospirillales bacterium]